MRIRVGNGEGVVLAGTAALFHDAISCGRPGRRRSARGSTGSARTGRPSRSESQALARGVPIELDARRLRAAPSSAGSRAPGRPTRSAFCSSGSSWPRTSGWWSLTELGLRAAGRATRGGGCAGGGALRAGRRLGSAVRSGATGSAPIRVRFRELSPVQQAALLRLDPLADREEYAELTALVEDERVPAQDLEQVSPSPEAPGENLGIDRWDIWPGPRASRSRRSSRMRAGLCCIVVDLGSVGTREEQARLPRAPCSSGSGAGRTRREPTAIVIDEAYNVCPAQPGPDHRARDRGRDPNRRRRAQVRPLSHRGDPAPAEGAQNVLSQCENLVLMRMNLAVDLAHVGRVFSFVPPALPTAPRPSDRARRWWPARSRHTPR